MSVAEKYIAQFNKLNGKLVTKASLQLLLTKIKSAKCDELSEVQTRIEKAIASMNGKPVKLTIQPPVKYIPVKQMAVVRQTKPKDFRTPAESRTVAVKSTREKGMNSAPGSNPGTATNTKNNNSRKLSGVVDASAIGKLSFKEIDLKGKYKKDFLKMYSDTQVMIWGKPGHGKTVYLLYFAQDLAEKGVNVLFIANEEMNRSTLTIKVNEHKIGHRNLKFTKNFEEMKKSGCVVEDFDIVIFDSIQSLGFKLDTYKKFVEDHPGICYILVAQSTKSGDFRGGQEWEHEVDIAGEILSRQLILRKNRLDPNFYEKSEKLLIEEKIKEKKKTILINDKLKASIKPKEESAAEPEKAKEVTV